MRQITGLFATALSLVGLYLVLRWGANAASIIRAIGSQSIGAFRVLQGRG